MRVLRLLISSPCFLAWGTVAVISAGFNASAQSTIDLSFNLDVDYVLANPVNFYRGAGSVTPFGGAMLTGTFSTSASLEITLPDGSFDIASTAITASANECTIIGTITGGTGVFAHSSGSVNLNYSPCGPDVPPVGSVQLTGTGSITIPSGGAFVVAPSALTFSFPQGSPPSNTQEILLENGTLLNVPYTIATGSQSWLSVSPSSGSVGALTISPAAVAVNSAGLTAGTYTGSVIVSAVGRQFVVSVTVLVNSAPEIVLSQTGLRFQAVTGGSATSPQSIAVINSGAGSLNFAAKASTLAGGNWLSVSPSSGTSSASSAGSVTATVNPAGLQPGDYYGQIQFTASGAANSPQIATVVLNVVSPDNSPGAFVQPSGLIFVGTAGGTNPAAKNLSITNPSPTPLNFLGTAFATSGSTSWIKASPTSGSVSATQPATVSVQPSVQGLAPGVYIGELVLNFISNNPAAAQSSQILQIEILLIVLPAGTSSPGESAATPLASGCSPTKLLPVFTLLASGFATVAAWPTAIEVTVVDDCGNPMVSGNLVASFSNGDPPLGLAPLKDGRWSATWQPVHNATQVIVTAQAEETAPPLKGTASIGGALQANAKAPAVSTGGIVSAASYAPNQPLAPGSFAAIFGSNLSSGLSVSTQLPLNVQLGGTSVLLAGEQVPLLFASNQQVNVVLPYDLPVNSTQQLIVTMGTAISIPQPVVIASAQPAVFSQDGSGSGAAIITAYQPDGTPLPADSPITAGDVITIYASGLGAVSPPVPAGSPAPASPLSMTTNPVMVTVGGMQAQVLFAGLAPMFAQLYQVNFIVPAGVPSGNAVILLAAGGQQSAPVTITLQ
jgi:uncharacterized protein (TIGR03437 family)